MTLKLVDTTKEYIRSQITAPADPTLDVVKFGFSTTGYANDAVWADGVWETVTGPPIKYYAKFLWGSAINLKPDHYTVFVRITDNPEVPCKEVGIVDIVGKPPKTSPGSITIMADADAVGSAV